MLGCLGAWPPDTTLPDICMLLRGTHASSGESKAYAGCGNAEGLRCSFVYMPWHS